MELAKLETKLGNLIVEQSDYTEEGYPGFFVTLRNGHDLVSVLLEVDQTEEESVCKVHIWDTKADDPIVSMTGICINNSITMEY